MIEFLHDSWPISQEKMMLTRDHAEWLCSLSVRDHVERLLAFHEADLSSESNRYFIFEGDKLHKVEATPEVQRLGGVSQIEISSMYGLGLPELHTRLAHTRLGVAYVIVSGLLAKETFHHITTRAVAMLLHDIQHPPLCHPVDAALQSEGYADHEERAQKVMRSSVNIRAALDMAGISLGDVSEIMQEAGVDGAYQAIFDTMSYSVLDWAMLGEPLPDDFEMRLIENFDGEAAGLLKVKRLGLLQALLEIRARGYREIYCSPRGRVGDSVLRQLTRLLLRGSGDHRLVPSGVMNSTDAPFISTLEHYVNNGAGSFWQAAWQLARGDATTLVRDWQLEAFGHDEAFESRIAELEADGKNFLVCPYFDHNKKKVRVFGPLGPVTLKAKSRGRDRLDEVAFILVYLG